MQQGLPTTGLRSQALGAPEVHVKDLLNAINCTPRRITKEVVMSRKRPACSVIVKIGVTDPWWFLSTLTQQTLPISIRHVPNGSCYNHQRRQRLLKQAH
jgi:hypothetical protein